MPFQKGKVANPKGRSGETTEQRRILKTLFSPHYKRAVERIAQSLSSPEREDHQWAVNKILEYSFPKPKEEIDLGAGDGAKVTLIIEAGTK